MAKKNSKIGAWAFIIGVIAAVILGLSPSLLGSWGLPLLVVLGLIIGLLNITGEEAISFLLSAVSLVIVAGFGGTALSVVPYLQDVFNAILALVIPATIIVALKAVYALAKN